MRRTIIKKVLKEYIVNITDTTKLKSFVDTSFTSLKESLLKVLPKIEDATAKIKVNEAINLITPVLESKKLKDVFRILTGKELENAHSGLADISATKELLEVIQDRFYT